jgi:acylglycerol lipase
MLAATGCTARLEPAGPPIQSPVLDTAGSKKKIVQADGTILPLKTWLPEGSPTAVIVALHGFNDYSNAFARPGAYWAKKKRIATYAFDQRGFGGAPYRGIWAGHATMTADLAEAVELIRKRHPGTPLFVLGESMGHSLRRADPHRPGAARPPVSGHLPARGTSRHLPLGPLVPRHRAGSTYSGI